MGKYSYGLNNLLYIKDNIIQELKYENNLSTINRMKFIFHEKLFFSFKLWSSIFVCQAHNIPNTLKTHKIQLVNHHHAISVVHC